MYASDTEPGVARAVQTGLSVFVDVIRSQRMQGQNISMPACDCEPYDTNVNKLVFHHKSFDLMTEGHHQHSHSHSGHALL